MPDFRLQVGDIPTLHKKWSAADGKTDLNNPETYSAAYKLFVENQTDPDDALNNKIILNMAKKEAIQNRSAENAEIINNMSEGMRGQLSLDEWGRPATRDGRAYVDLSPEERQALTDKAAEINIAQSTYEKFKDFDFSRVNKIPGFGGGLLDIVAPETSGKIKAGVLSGFQRFGEPIRQVLEDVHSFALDPLFDSLGIEARPWKLATGQEGIDPHQLSAIAQYSLGEQSAVFSGAEWLTEVGAYTALAMGGAQIATAGAASLGASGTIGGLVGEGIGFGGATFLTTPGTYEQRLKAGGIDAIFAGAAGRISDKLIKPIAGGISNRLLKVSHEAGLSTRGFLTDALALKAVPAVAEGAFMAGVNTVNQAAVAHALGYEDFNMLNAYGTNLAIMPFFMLALGGKNRAMRTEQLRKTTGLLSTAENIPLLAKELEKGIKGPLNPDGIRVDPWVVKTARALAERHQRLRGPQASEIVRNPHSMQAVLAGETFVGNMPTHVYERWLTKNRQAVLESADHLALDADLVEIDNLTDRSAKIQDGDAPVLPGEGGDAPLQLPARLQKLLEERSRLVIRERGYQRMAAYENSHGSRQRRDWAIRRVQGHREKLAQVDAMLAQGVSPTLARNPYVRMDWSVARHSPSEYIITMENVRPTLAGKKRINELRRVAGVGEVDTPTPADMKALSDYVEQTQPDRRAKRKRLEKPIDEQRKLLVETHRWVREYRDWTTNGSQGDMPNMSKRMLAEGIGPLEAVTLLEESVARASDNIADAAARIVPSNSHAAQNMAMGGEIAKATFRHVKDAGNMLKPTQLIGPLTEAVPGSERTRVDNPMADLPLEANIDKAVEHYQKTTEEILSHIDRNDTPGILGSSDGMGAGQRMMKPNWFDRTFRQQFLVLQKLFPSKLGLDLSDLVLARSFHYTALNESAIRWLDHNMASWKSYIDETRRSQGDAAADAKIRRLFDLREGALEIGKISQPEAEALQALERFFKAYEKPLKAMGVKLVKDKPYISRIMEGMEQLIMDPYEKSRFARLRSRFTKERNKANAGDVLKDVEAILQAYVPSINRMIAYQPVVKTYRSLIENIGIAPEPGARGFAELNFGILGKHKMPLKEGGMSKAAAEFLVVHSRMMAGEPGAASKWMEAKTDYILDSGKKFIKATTGKDIGERFGARELFGGMSALYNGLGVGGLPVGGAIRNIVTGGAISWADPALGPGYFIKGLMSLYQGSAEGGGIRYDPRLEKIGITEQIYTANIRREIQQNLTGHLNDISASARDVWLSMFGWSEMVVRGATALGAWDHAIANGATQEAAERIARNVAARTQTNYDAITGARFFAGSFGRVFGQFQRFGWNSFDHFFGLIQRSGVLGEAHKMSGEARLPTIAQMQGKMNIGAAERPLANLAMFLMTIWGTTLLAEELNITMPEVSGPFGSNPEIVKFLGKTAIEQGGRAFGADAETRGDIQKWTGLDSFNQNLWGALVDSSGPGVNAAVSGLNLVRASAMNNKEIQKEMEGLRLITGGGTTIDRIFRYAQETRDGYIKSRASGHRLYPNQGGRLTSSERLLRLLGLQPTSVDEAMSRLGDIRTRKNEYQVKRSDLQGEIRQMLEDGENPYETMGYYWAALDALSQEYGTYTTWKDMRRSWNAMVADIDERTQKSLSERELEKQPFALPGTPKRPVAPTIFPR